MTGLCCRHQVRHDDELCCEHGITHRGDSLHHDDGSHRWTSTSTRGGLIARHEAAIAAHVADGHTHEEGASDVALVSAVAIGIGAVIAVCAHVGASGSDSVKVVLGILLGAIALGTIVVLMRGWSIDVEDDPPAWVGPGTFTNDTEPKE